VKLRIPASALKILNDEGPAGVPVVSAVSIREDEDPDEVAARVRKERKERKAREHTEKARAGGQSTAAKDERKKKATTKAPNKKKAAKSKKEQTETHEKKEPAKEVSSGPPDEPLEGGWPDGWTKRVFERQSGSTKGTKDRYWYSPANKKFRSMNEVKRFLAALKTCKGDEGEAWNVFKKTK
jgi:hypothetical protein